MKKVLIANRGEIALRIQRACAKLSLKAVQVASEVDMTSLAARTAHEVAPLKTSQAISTYLNIPLLLQAAKHHECDALHPGYGFLSESPDFAQAVEDSGLTWIGPPPISIRSLGSKTNARTLAKKAGVPITDGSTTAQSDEELLRSAKKTGFPVIIKAVAGGGGRGMRVAFSERDFKEAIPLARQEAKKNFGSEAIYFERFIKEPRHVEVQIFADNHGHVVHLGTRDCSSQRRHQKLIEEAPAPYLSQALRDRIQRAAVRVAKVAGYSNAGTAEFLVRGDNFYFLEMNTRIQVEHPVTEEITGIDLVGLQLQVAMGEKLPFKQRDIDFNGHAIELRINAEAPCENFRPTVGQIESITRVGNAPWIREDFGYEAKDSISPYYDSLISKLIVKGSSREEALYRAFNAASEYDIKGIETTLPFHRWMLATSTFQKGAFDIGFVEREFKPESLQTLSLLHYRDPTHRNPTHGFFHIERLSTEYGKHIELHHEEGGTFLAIPLLASGKRTAKRFWLRSNSRETLLKAL